MPEKLPLTEACMRAKVGYFEAWRAVTSGRVPAERRGRSLFVDPRDLHRLLAGEREPVPAA